jgi:uncharacterized membrane protein (UPF0127 family)
MGVRGAGAGKTLAMPARPSASPSTPRPSVRVVRDDGAVLCERCDVADTLATRLRGLLGRDRLEPGDGLLLRPAGSVHTCFMRMPIDLVLLDGDLRVLRTVAGLAPWRAAGAWRARAALELAAGQAAARGVRPGDTLQLLA